jgi:tetratricopeptide (TPR) repeat protein
LPLDREDTLTKAEKFLRQGRLDAAIAEYVRVVEDQPKDWNTANTLGDLYMRAGQTASAVAQFVRIGEHFLREGFYPKAGALFKKILKISPDDEMAQLYLAEISTKQGLLADAKSYLTAVGARRLARMDRRGADEIVLRLGDLDPADFEARLAAARLLADSGDGVAAAGRFRQIYEDLLERGRKTEAQDVLREAVRLNPGDTGGRALLAREALAAGDCDRAREYLGGATAGDDPALMLALAEVELRSGQLWTARQVVPKLLALDGNARDRVIELAWDLTSTQPKAAFVCIEAVVDASVARADRREAASILEEFVARVPNQVSALLRLVEVCGDGGLEETMFAAQAQLADAYLAAGQAAEARAIAEDLVAREPRNQTHLDRFRKTLVMLNVEDPDTVIAERLRGQDASMATDPFTENLLAAPEPVEQSTAAVMLAEQPEIHAGDAALKDADVEGLDPAVPQSEGQQAVPRPPGSMEIDLTSLLAEFESYDPAPMLQPAPPREDLEQVFQDFRDEVTKQVGADEAAQHLTLANTYLEMGMEEDAIQSLKTAARSPHYRFDAGTRLARLFKTRNDMTQAVEWMERAAEAPAPSAEAGLALLYDLGAALEGLGETGRALAVFMELQADAGQYRDVNEKVERLSRVQAGG